jgi:hypothetical protein
MSISNLGCINPGIFNTPFAKDLMFHGVFKVK